MDNNNNQSDSVETPGLYYPQDYWLKTVSFLPANGKKIELKKLITDLSFYEDIFSFCVSGHVTIIDAQGFLELLQLTGNEFLELEFGKVKDSPNVIKQVFRVYKTSDRVPSGNLNSEAYTLYFCSEELLLSEQIKISKSFKGTKVDSIINNILTNYLKVNSKKIEKIEETSGVYDFLVPRLKPFEAISWLSTYARPKGLMGSDMLFFETKYGFNFRSLQNMFKQDIYATYKYQAKNIEDKTQSMQEKITTVIEYEFGKPYDKLNEINAGSFANQLISIDPLTRTYKKTNFDYTQFKAQAKTLNTASPSNDFKNRLGKLETELYEGVMKVAIGNSNQQSVPYIKSKEAGVAKDIFIETYVPNRTAQISLSNYTTLKISIPGDPGIAVGKTINFNLMSLKPTEKDKKLDKFYSGKYLVTAVRHQITVPNQYITILELAKDSMPAKFSDINSDNVDLKELENS